MLSCDSIKIVSFLTDAFLNASNYSYQSELNEILQELIDSFRTIEEAINIGDISDKWKKDYNENHSHGSLGGIY